MGRRRHGADFMDGILMMSDLQIDIAFRRFQRDFASTINRRRGEIARLSVAVSELSTDDRLCQALAKLQDTHRRLADRKGGLA